MKHKAALAALEDARNIETKCQCFAGAELVTTPHGPHFGKLVCPRCGKFIDWVAKPGSEKIRRTKPSRKLLRPHIDNGVDYCVICLRRKGELPRGMVLQAHHIVPVELGGTDAVANILPVCDGCHAFIHNMRRTVGKLSKENKFEEPILVYGDEW